MSSAESSNFSNSSATPSRANTPRPPWNHRIIVIVVPLARVLGGEGVLHICTTTITIFPNILSSIEKTDPFCRVCSRSFFVAPTFATVGPRGPRGQHLARSPPACPDATRGHPLAHGASAKVARSKSTWRPANGSFPAIFSGRRQWEPTQSMTEFVFDVRTYPGAPFHEHRSNA
jgi:hypothetical protein